jgi:hypothetical protein
MTAGPEDLAALREDGDLERYLRSLVSSAQPQPEPTPAEPEAPAEPEYFIAHRGAWPIGTAPSGPTPMNGRCSCPKCNQAA